MFKPEKLKINTASCFVTLATPNSLLKHWQFFTVTFLKMAPFCKLPVFDIDSIIPPYVPPIPDDQTFEIDSTSDEDFSSSTSSSEVQQVPQCTSIYEPIEIPIEQNLRELLVCLYQK